MLPAMVDHNVFRRSPAARAEAPPPRQRAALSLAAVVPSGGGASRQQAARSGQRAAGLWRETITVNNRGQQSLPPPGRGSVYNDCILQSTVVKDDIMNKRLWKYQRRPRTRRSLYFITSSGGAHSFWL